MHFSGRVAVYAAVSPRENLYNYWRKLKITMWSIGGWLYFFVAGNLTICRNTASVRQQKRSVKEDKNNQHNLY